MQHCWSVTSDVQADASGDCIVDGCSGRAGHPCRSAKMPWDETHGGISRNLLNLLETAWMCAAFETIVYVSFD